MTELTMENKPNRIIWHHTADMSTRHQSDKVNTWHKKLRFTKSALGFFGGYHILIEKDGFVFRYRNDNEIGCHDKDENVNSLGIAMAGNFNLEYPTEEQKIAFTRQLKDWIIKWNIPINRIDPHRMGDATDCPGKRLADDWARKLIENFKPTNASEVLLDIIKYIQSKI